MTGVTTAVPSPQQYLWYVFVGRTTSENVPRACSRIEILATIYQGIFTGHAIHTWVYSGVSHDIMGKHILGRYLQSW